MAEWEPNFDVYMANVDGAATSFVVDMNAAKSGPIATHPRRIQVRVKLLSPLPNGLRGAGELEAMGKVEDIIVAAIETKLEGLYVGRYLGGGFTTFVFYAPAASAIMDLGAAIGPLGDYRAEWLTEEDPQWRYYFQFLFPDDASREQMTNRAQIEQRKQIGDRLDVPREIDHFAIFPSRKHAEDACIALTKAGFRVGEPTVREEQQTWTLEFHRVDSLDQGRPNVFCAEIRGLLGAFDGNYDGWGAIVVKDPAPG